MKSSTFRRASITLVLALVGCSSSGRNQPRKEGSALQSYSCDVTFAGMHTCAEYQWTGAAGVAKSYASACDSAGGTSATTCDRADAIGGCTVEQASGSIAVTTVTWYYAGNEATIEQACAAASGEWQTGNGGGGGGGGGSNDDPDADVDADGYSPNEGDCDDHDPLINPGAIEIAKNQIDDDCNGKTDEAATSCETGLVGLTDATSLAGAMGLCNLDVLLEAKLVGPSDVRARAIVDSFGLLEPESSAAMLVLSTGIAADVNSSSFESPQSGVSLGATNTRANPAPTLPITADCGQSNPATVNDYSELAITLRVPNNANSFRFRSLFLSAEYPEFVCTSFNDAFIVLLDDGVNPQRNIVTDDGGHPITVNNGYFRVCENDASKPQTQNCTRPISEIANTGFDTTQSWDDVPVGGATGWLQTTAPVSPGSEIKLRFIIWDAGDHIYDSTVLIDDFVWSTEMVDDPNTSG